MPYASVYIQTATRDFDRPYTYRYDSELNLQIGDLVEVPFGRGKRILQAVVCELLSSEQVQTEFNYKQIARKLYPYPIVNAEQIHLAREMRRRYYCSIGLALKTIAPLPVVGIGPKKQLIASLIDAQRAVDMLIDNEFTSLQQVRVVEMLLQYGEATITEITQSCSVSSGVVKTLASKGIITLEKGEVTRNEIDFAVEPNSTKPELNSEQRLAFTELKHALEIKVGKPTSNLADLEYLLFGITGSGKTEVYLQITEEVLKQGKTVLVLVPEIALTPMMVARFVGRFGDQAAILHSRLTNVERYEQWQQIRSGQKRLVIGARSAIFAPLENIGLIIVDEEHENTYKSEVYPCYDARDLARIRSLYHKSLLVLGSATPRITDYWRTEKKKAHLLTLVKRAVASQLPQTFVVNYQGQNINQQIFSEPLIKAMQDAFERKEQVMLFHNRRGRSHHLFCADCGYELACDHCNLLLTEHINLHAEQAYATYGHETKRLICHCCGAIKPVPPYCPECGSANLHSSGAGTQAIERKFQELFPDKVCLRMDADTTAKRQAHQAILDKFARGEADCLIGTQMIAKGHDFSRVTVVGIVFADALLNRHAYTGAETGFALMTQAAGRAGRAKHPGSVYVQTYQPGDYAIANALRQDYLGFYRAEISLRETYGYPPFKNIAWILVSGKDFALVKQEALSINYFVKQAIVASEALGTVENFGVSEAAVNRIRDMWRLQIILKDSDLAKLNWLLTQITDNFKRDGVLLHCEINPNNIN